MVTEKNAVPVPAGMKLWTNDAFSCFTGILYQNILRSHNSQKNTGTKSLSSFSMKKEECTVESKMKGAHNQRTI